MTPEVRETFTSIRIYFGGILHASIRRSEILGLTSWRWDHRQFFIEFTLRGGSLLLEYDDETNWKSLLEQLDRIDNL